jgi:antitoxin component of RelBE/YafQ-DinJ toxin-antitoxin module
VATRTVRLDDEAEAALQQIRDATGLPISEALKRGLRSLQERIKHETKRTAYDIYQELDLGPGGYAVAPSTETRRGVAEVIRKKLHR